MSHRYPYECIPCDIVVVNVPPDVQTNERGTSRFTVSPCPRCKGTLLRIGIKRMAVEETYP